MPLEIDGLHVLEVLTKPPQPPDEAAPVRFGLRGRRLLWFNELEEKHPIQSTIFKDFRDHATTLTARALYGDNVDFNVTWGMVLATNSRVSWTAEDGGVGRSLTKVRWPLRFVAPGMPLGPNDRVVDLRWKATAVVDSVAVGLLYLLLQALPFFGGDPALISLRAAAFFLPPEGLQSLSAPAHRHPDPPATALCGP